MSDGNSFRQRRNFPRRSQVRLETLVRSRKGWCQICSPLALGLLGLAIAVVLWGYGYKLSLYYQAPDPADRVPVAKLWIEHRYGFAAVSQSATGPRLKLRVYADAGSAALTSSAPELYLVGTASPRYFPKRPRSVPFFHTAIPLRSPPPVISL